MRLGSTGLALSLLIPLATQAVAATAPAAGSSTTASSESIQAQLTTALKNNVSIETALKQIIEANPDQAYAAISAAVQLSPDQGANIVSAALNRQYNLNPAQVVAAALQGTPEKAGIIVPTAIVKSPSYYTVPIVQRALAEGVDGAKFVPQAMRTSPRQADTILTQALRSAPNQTKSIMEAVITDQPDKATEYVRIALEAGASPTDVLTAAFKVAPRQAEAIAAVAAQKGVSSDLVKAASQAAGVEVAGLSNGNNNSGSSARDGSVSLPTQGSPSAGGGGGGGSGSASPN